MRLTKEEKEILRDALESFITDCEHDNRICSRGAIAGLDPVYKLQTKIKAELRGQLSWRVKTFSKIDKEFAEYCKKEGLIPVSVHISEI